MTALTTHTTRLDQCPHGLVHVAAHGDIPGGLTWKCESGAVYDVAELGPENGAGEYVPDIEDVRCRHERS